ncbi:ATP-binding protein [Pseudomonas viridiflava]|uniref:ATP-binding protein n=1 Tax=Pseudomonas viridiflava TaxID=33069 RepID=UPI0018E5F837|nr:ATP-binding protein [Pseudomonas viridiflava]MBI6705392.1 ATP-binding protein [Pseudomonas viridiflava]MBI6725361.1 ATP-binding protein [Pseudomonas viridiflava]
MSNAFQVRLALVAPSGSGKSTTAQLLGQYFQRAGMSVDVIKLAEPLYELQGIFYEQAGVHLVKGSQNQSLLECIARELRALSDHSLIDNFARRLADSTAQVIINDDLRDDATDWPFLRDEGFQVIKVLTESGLRQSRLEERGDVSVVQNSALDQQMDRIKADYVLPNNRSLRQLEERIAVIAQWALTASRCRMAS